MQTTETETATATIHSTRCPSEPLNGGFDPGLVDSVDHIMVVGVIGRELVSIGIAVELS